MEPTIEEIRSRDEMRRSAAMYRSRGYSLIEWYENDYPRDRRPRPPIAEVKATYNARLLQHNDSTIPDRLPWTEHLTVLLCAVRSSNGHQHGQSPLALFAGQEESVVRKIYEYVLGSWKASVQPARPASMIASPRFGNRQHLEESVAFAPCGNIQFPPPANRKVNMMPFVMGNRESLPTDLQAFYDQLVSACPVGEQEYGRVCYLTVHESYVEAGQMQRRGGLHVESPGTHDGSTGLNVGRMAHWGCGRGDNYVGGLFMCSSVGGTTQIFDDLIDHGYGTVDKHGGIEHLRPYLGVGTVLDANELVWFTDRTPHEALPQPVSGYRQFFRLVTSKLSVWYEAHSTPNPMVPVPKGVKIIKGSKFQ